MILSFLHGQSYKKFQFSTYIWKKNYKREKNGYFRTDESLWDNDNFIADYSLIEKRTKEVAPSTISVKFVELRRFTKAKEECKTEKDWLFYLFRSINLFDDLREELNVEHFPLIEKMEQACKFAAMNPEQHSNYANIMRCERDYFSDLANAKAEAREEALAEGIKRGQEKGIRERNMELAKAMISEKMPPEQISRLLGLTTDQISAIQAS